MAYIDYEYYIGLYDNPDISEKEFKRYAYDVEKRIDSFTTGIDNVRKLKIAFPVDEDDSEAVKRCIVAMIDLTHRIKEAEKTMENAKGFMVRSDGSMQGKVVKSISSGNESITYSSGTESVSIIDKALADKKMQYQLYRDMAVEYLSGVTDANGVNLLYMGRYPNVR